MRSIRAVAILRETCPSRAKEKDRLVRVIRGACGRDIRISECAQRNGVSVTLIPAGAIAEFKTTGVPRERTRRPGRQG
jgi:hypothetical protein